MSSDNLDITISGIECNPYPSAGIGIAKSIRDAYPESIIRAWGYDPMSTGLHHPVFDTAEVCTTSPGLNLQSVLQHIEKPNCYWISGRDSEAANLSLAIPHHPQLLSAGHAVLKAVLKPAVACAGLLQMLVPTCLPATSASTDLQRLGSLSGWNLWLKGHRHGATRINSFRQLRQELNQLRERHLLHESFVQENVSGTERAVAFCAAQGQVIAAAEVEKQYYTANGKTWGATVLPASPLALERITMIAAATAWTGGGEVEFIRDSEGRDWLLDVNPRFPATIYGITLCGQNLPAKLLREVSGFDFSVRPTTTRQFVRVVQEIPVRSPSCFSGRGSCEDELAVDRNQTDLTATVPAYQENVDITSFAEESPPEIHQDLVLKLCRAASPQRVRSLGVVEATIAELEISLSKCLPVPRVIPALSVKTDPYLPIAQLFLKKDWWAEVISLEELSWATEIGFAKERIVFNGPAVAELHTNSRLSVAVAFADSAQAFESILQSGGAGTVGLRVRPTTIPSRFGINLTDPVTFQRIGGAISSNRNVRHLGLHIHSASDRCGVQAWLALIVEALDWAARLSEKTGVPFSVFDVGGGWDSEVFRRYLVPRLSTLQGKWASRLPGLQTIIIEPGKAMSSRSAWLVSTIIEVRSSACSQLEVIVDVSIAELPMARHRAHSVLHTRGSQMLSWLGGGYYRILGCTCMEFDVLADNIGFFVTPRPGDRLVFAEAGGYNASMSYSFGKGRCRDSDPTQLASIPE